MASTLLTDSKIRGLKPKTSAYYTWQASAERGTGRLGLKTYPSGRKTFYYRYYIQGKEKFIKLGDYPQISLSEAGDRARKAAENPAEAKSPAESFSSLKGLFNDYIAHQKTTGRRGWEKTENRLAQVLNSPHVNPEIPAREVTPNIIKLVIAEFIQRGAVAGSNKARGALHAAFNFGLFADNDPAKLSSKTRYGLTVNPVAAIPKQAGAEKALDRFLAWDELAALLKLIRVSDLACPMSPDFARLLLLCIYTGGQRPWELLANAAANYDKKGKVLTVPPEISKTKDFHVIPLSPLAIEIIETQLKLYPKSAYLFPAKTAPGHLLSAEFSKQLRKFCKLEGFAPFTPRDIRRTFKTLAGEMGVSSELRDRLQNHKIAGTSSKHYDRYDYLKEKRAAIATWTKRISQL